MAVLSPLPRPMLRSAQRSRRLRTSITDNAHPVGPRPTGPGGQVIHPRTGCARSNAANRLGDILSVNSSTGSFLDFSLNDSPLIAAVVATVVPAQHTGAVTEIRQSDPNTAFLLLGGIFSALMALNLAFIRHLRREYASPRRGVWRGGEGSVENP